jgi:hypothetical protein
MIKDKLNILVIGLLLGILFSCGFAQKNDKQEEKLLTTDSLMGIVNESFKVNNVELLDDTILIISENEILFYPLGEYTNFKKFQEQYLEKQIKEPKIDYTKSKRGSNVINIRNKNTFVKLIETEIFRKEGQRLEIVSANINDVDFEFVNGIKIGMSKKDFLLKIFSIVPEELEKIPVIKIASAVDFIEYYYTFSEDNTIKNITIITDYVL